MKRLPVLLIFLVSALVSRAQELKPSFLQEIFYTIPVKEVNLGEADDQPGNQDTAASATEKFAGKLFNEIKAGKLKVFRPQHPYKTPMSAAEVKNIFTSVDSVYVEDPGTGRISTVAKVNEMSPADVAVVGFYENWYYDSIAHLLEKEVKGIVFFQRVMDDFGEARGMRPLFFLPLNAPDMSSILAQGNIAVPSITYNTRIKNINWEMRESDWWYENLEPSKRHAFISSLYSPALNGKLNVYKADPPFDTPITTAQLEKIITVWDSIEIFDDAGEPYIQAVKSQPSVYDINQVRFHETWYFDPVKLAMYKQIKGFALLQDAYNPYGELDQTRSKPLFYVKGKGKNDPSSASSLPPSAQKPGISQVKGITYPVRILNSDAFTVGSQWYHQRLEPSAQYHLITPLLKRIRSGEIQAYRPSFPYSLPLTKAEVDSVLDPMDEMFVYTDEDPYEHLVKVKLETTHDHIYALDFHEEWHFDTLGNVFQKKVKGITLLKSSPEREFLVRLLYIPLNTAEASSVINEKNLVTSLITYDVTIRNPDEGMRETMWWDNNLEPSKRAMLRAATFHRGCQGRTNVYSAEYPFAKQLKGADLDKIIIRYDTVFVEDIQTGRLNKTPAPSPVDAHSINAVRFHEEWYFDHSKMAMHKVVKGMVMLAEQPDEMQGRFDPLFYVPVNGNNPAASQKPLQVKVPRINYLVTANDLGTSLKGLDTARFLTGLRQIVIKAKKGEQKTYKPLSLSDVDPPQQEMMATSEWMRHFESADSILVETEGEPVYQVIPWQLPDSDIRGTRFTESWTFDPVKYTFSKQVYGMDISIQRELGPIIGYITVFNVPVEPGDKKMLKNKALLLGKEIESEVRLEPWPDYFLPYDFWWNDALELSKRTGIIQKILDDVSSNKIAAYDPETKKKLAAEELKKRMICKAENYDTGNLVYVDVPLTHFQVYALRFHEEWYFDGANNRFMKKVKGITLMTKVPEKEALQQVFYVKMKN